MATGKRTPREDSLQMPQRVTRQFRPPPPESRPYGRTAAERRNGLLVNMFQQIYQNARRAGATWIEVETRDRSFTASHDGRGEPDPSKLRHGVTSGDRGAAEERLSEALRTGHGGPDMAITALRRGALRVTSVSRDEVGRRGWTVEMPPASPVPESQEHPHVTAGKAVIEDVALLRGGTGTVTAVDVGPALPGDTAEQHELALAARTAKHQLPLPVTINGCRLPSATSVTSREAVPATRVPWARIGVAVHPWRYIGVPVEDRLKPGVQQARIDIALDENTANTYVFGVETTLFLPVVAGNYALYRALVDVTDPKAARKTLLEPNDPDSREARHELYTESLKRVFETIADHDDIVPFATRDKARRVGVDLPEPKDIELLPWTGGTARSTHAAGVYALSDDPLPGRRAVIVDVPGMDRATAAAFLAAAALQHERERHTPGPQHHAARRIMTKDTVLAKPCAELAGYAAYDRIPRITSVEILYTDPETNTREPIDTYRVNHLSWTTRARYAKRPHRGLPRVPDITVRVTMKGPADDGAGTGRDAIETMEHWETPFAIVAAGRDGVAGLGADEVLLSDDAERLLATLTKPGGRHDRSRTLAEYLTASLQTDAGAPHRTPDEVLETMQALSEQLLVGSDGARTARLEHALQRAMAEHGSRHRASHATVRLDPGTATAEPVVTVAYDE